MASSWSNNRRFIATPSNEGRYADRETEMTSKRTVLPSPFGNLAEKARQALKLQIGSITGIEAVNAVYGPAVQALLDGIKEIASEACICSMDYGSSCDCPADWMARGLLEHWDEAIGVEQSDPDPIPDLLPTPPPPTPRRVGRIHGR